MVVLGAPTSEDRRPEACIAMGWPFCCGGADRVGCLPTGAAPELEDTSCFPCVPAQGSGGQPTRRTARAVGGWWGGVRGGAHFGCPAGQRQAGVPRPLERLWVVGGLLGAGSQPRECAGSPPIVLERPGKEGWRMILFLASTRGLQQRPVGCFVWFCVGAATGGLLIISAATGGLRKICIDCCLGAPFPQDGCVLCFVLHFGCMGCVTVVMCVCGWPLPARE